MFQMQTYVILLFSFYIGVLSAGLENVLRQAEYLADIYQQVPNCYNFIINPEA